MPSSDQPWLLRLVYKIVPMDLANRILPPNASFGRQAFAVGGVSMLVGASMELFMIKTGFYAIATKKEAERRSMTQWQQEESERLRKESERKALIAAGGPEAVAELKRNLIELREREKNEHVMLEKEKYQVKAQLKRLA